MANRRVDYDRVIVAYRAGEDIGGIAEDNGIRYATVYKVLSRCGEPLRGRVIPTTVEQQGSIVAAYQSGEKIAVIAERNSVSEVTVHNILRRTCQPRNRRSGAKPLEWSDDDLAVIKALRLEGLPKAEIAAALRTGDQRVSRAFDQLGLSHKGRPRNAKERLRTRSGYSAVRLQPDDPFHSMVNSGGYVLEHRLVVARKLGRPLLASETVHHIDGVRSHNDEANLQLRQGSHGKGVAMTCRDCGSTNVAPVSFPTAS